MKCSKNRLLLAAAMLCLAAVTVWGLRRRDGHWASTAEQSYTAAYTKAASSGDTAAFAGEMVSEGLHAEAVYPGEYTVSVQYGYAAAGSRFEVVDTMNNLVLADTAIDPNAPQTELTFRLDHHVNELVLRCYAGEDGWLDIVNYSLRSTGPVYTDTWWIAGFTVLFAAVGWLLWRRYRAGSARPFQLYLLASAASLPFVTAHLPNGHDVFFHLSRIYGLGLALLSGQFPVRLNWDFWDGLGYISPIMYPELFLYSSGIMCALGSSVMLACKMLMIGATFATVFVAYYAMRKMLGDRGAVFFTVLYLLNPYRMNEFYIRAAIGEGLAMVFLPLVLAGLWNLLQADYRKGFWMASLGITGVLQSHIISTFLVVVFGVVYGAAVLLADGRRFFADRRRPLTLLGAAAATVGLNLWYLVPFLHFSRWDLNIYQNPLVKLTTAWVYLPQVFMETYSTNGELHTLETQGDMTLSVGFALLLCLLLFVLLLPRMEKSRRSIGLGCLGMGALALFFCSDLFPWGRIQETLPAVYDLFGKMQFSWRMLIIVCVCWTVTAAIAMEALWQQNYRTVAGVVLSMAMLSGLNASSGYLNVNETALRGSNDNWIHDMLYEGQYLLTEVDLEKAGEEARRGVVSADTGEALDWSRRGGTLTFSFAGLQPGERIQLPLYGYFNLYRATLADTGEVLPLSLSDWQLLQVTTPVSGGTVTVQVHEPMRFRLGELASLATAAALAALELRRRKKEGISHGN